MKYNLNTLSGRLKALADDFTLEITTELSGTLLFNKHTLPADYWVVANTNFPCSLTPKSISLEQFEEACEKLGFEGIIRDTLREELFSSEGAKHV